MHLTTKLLLGVSLVTALAGTAFAASPNGASERWQKIDTNGNTVIEKSEFMAKANEKFSLIDSNGDGFATKDERRQHRDVKRGERAERKFQRMDLNGDGDVSSDEYDQLRAQRDAKREARRDVNGDGVVNEADMEARKAKREARRAERAANGESRRSKGKRERFKVDANGDDMVDFAEHSAAAEHMFARLDQNGDGVLTSEEQKTRKRRGKRKRHRTGG